MKSIFKKIIIIIIIVFSLNIIIAKILDNLYESSYSGLQNGTLNYYLKEQTSDTLLLGSSYVMHNLIPSIFGEKTFNLSCQQKYIGYQTSIIELLYQQNKLPSKVLLLNIDPEEIHKNDQEKLINQIQYLKYYYDKNEFIKKEINKSSPTEFLKYYFTSYRHNGTAIRLIANSIYNKNEYPKQKGFYPLSPTTLDSARMIFSLRLNEKYEYYNSKTVNYEALRFIKRIQSICKKKKIKLIIMTSPFYTPHKDVLRASNYLNNYLKRKKIPYINYIKNPNIDYLKRELWHDNFHFNSKGAIIFSKIVLHDMSLIK